MKFRHMLAYGNSDQASFRNAEVQRSFDVMTVPGTIASYYSEATAAFVLSSQIDYVIDPRTPLFQGDLDSPRASHFTLAEWHGSTVGSTLAATGRTAFDLAFWAPAVVGEMVTEIISRQRNYADNASIVHPKLDRYATLLATAMQEQGEPAPATEAKGPYSVLAPYFAVSGTSDPWWTVMQQVWTSCAALTDPADIIPVLCVDGRPKTAADGVATLEALMPHLPNALSNVCFFWITNFDERKVTEPQLRKLWQVVAARPEGRELVNMYGGFFSICLRHAGLTGFGNGLTYSESRDWPALASTGAAPPRYYVRDLHAFLPPALAASLVDFDASFECPCDACTAWRRTGGSVASLPYHDLKRHFAMARRWELDLTATAPLSDIAWDLRDSNARADNARNSSLVLRALPSTEFLERWAAVLDNH
jgi:hypothetical protein